MVDIVILHCHFERGGVTQVIENHVRALADSDPEDRIWLVSDRRQDGLSSETLARAQTLLVPGLDYDSGEIARGSASTRSLELTERLESAFADQGIEPGSSVIHWHNHSLGKNTAAPLTVRRLAAAGWRLLLQVHDFAEDNRPENYLGLISASDAKTTGGLDQQLYPIAPQIHYGTLTSGDRRVLLGLGIPESQTHCLPNCVRLPGGTHPDRDECLSRLRRVLSLPDEARWCLYPVRGIRRKNVGEFLLLCRWLPDDMHGGLTLRPTTPVEAKSYDRWRRVSADVSPRAVFEAGHHKEIGFVDNLAAADFVVSTSVAEGFGMAFLEPWLAMRRVIARRLPGVTNDFEKSGVEMDGLYDRIPIPGDPSWVKGCSDRTGASFDSAWSAIPDEFRPESRSDPQESLGTIDFARLTTPDQVAVLRRLASEPSFEADVKQQSDPLIRSLCQTDDPEILSRNAEVVGREYSTDRQANQLRGVYRELLNATIDHSPGGPTGEHRAVDLVSEVRPFYPCRTETLIDA